MTIAAFPFGLVTSALLLCARVESANFTAGNILALRVTSGSALTSAATAIVLEELNSTTGTQAQPAIAVGVCTLSGTNTLQGQLSLSPDGANSAFACFAATVGSADPTTQGSVQRGAVILNGDATISSFSGFGAAYQNPARGVYSAVVASSVGNFYVAGDGGNVRGGLRGPGEPPPPASASRLFSCLGAQD